MAITRRSAQFGAVARDVDRLLAERGVTVNTRDVDAELNARIEHVARLMRIEPRSAMFYMPEDLPTVIAADLATAPPPQEGGAVT